MFRRTPLALVACALAAAAVPTVAVYRAHAQSQTPPGLPTEITQIRHNTGQSVVPYYEGWIRNPDGTFDLVFGYFNRNFTEQLSIPVGPDNKVEPGPVDAGQPTFFDTRRHRFLFRVRVPANFGKGVVTWSVTSHGRTERAFGDLIAPEEITERVVATNGNFNPGLEDPNKPPSITVAPITGASVGTALALTASVVDDGLPAPRPVRAAPPPPPPTPGQPNFAAQVNSSGRGRPRGLSVSWLLYRGPAPVTFTPDDQVSVTNGQATTNLHFKVPGVYRLMGTANDGAISTTTFVNVTVAGGPSTASR